MTMMHVYIMGMTRFKVLAIPTENVAMRRQSDNVLEFQGTLVSIVSVRVFFSFI